MTYLISSDEDWGNTVVGTENGNKYTRETLVGAACIEDAITLWKQNLKDRQNVRPQLTATIASIKKSGFCLIT
jgi:hypothetical protein